MPPFATLNLRPLMLVQLVLVCFFLHLSRTTGETSPPRPEIRHPRVARGAELVLAPLVEISPTDLRIASRLATNDVELTQAFVTMKSDEALLHPGEPFEGRLVISADRETPWRQLRPVLAAARQHDYHLIDFVVQTPAW